MSSAPAAPLSLTLADQDPWFVEQRIFDLLFSYLQPNSSSSSIETARSFDSLLPEHRAGNPDGSTKESTSDFLWNAWESVHRIAQQVPHDNHDAHERLASFLAELKRIQSDPASVLLPNWGDAPHALWADMPLFAPPLRELLDRVSPLDPESRNLNAYMARIFREGIVDLSHFATRALDQAHPSNGFGIEISHIWIEVAGDAVWKACKSNSRSETEDGLTAKRWELLYQQYGDLIESNGEIDRERTAGARKLMEDIQSR